MIDILTFAALPILQVVGCYAAVVYYLRMRAAQGSTRWFWLFLTSATGGGVGWTAQFVFLTKIPPGNLLFWDPHVLAGTFVVGISGLAIMIISAEAAMRTGRRVLTAGVFGSVYTVLFVAVTAFLINTATTQGTVEFSQVAFAACTVLVFVLTSLGGGLVFFGGTTKRLGFGAVLLTAPNPLVQYIILSTMTLVPDPLAPMPSGLTAAETETIMLVCAALIVGVFGGTGLAMDQFMTAHASERLRKLAMTDTLTQLPNRSGFHAALEKAMGDVHENRKHMLCLALDLDKFKPVNDLHGHAAGDALLRAISQRLAEARAPGEVIARVGGDEFVAFKLFSPYADQERVMEEFDLRLRGAITAPVRVGEVSINVDVSAGASIAPTHGTDADSLLGSADIALYKSKEAQGEVFLYTDKMGDAIRRRAETAQEIKRALAEEEFELYFQKQNDVLTGAVIGYEALIRWRHPTRGLLPPGEFIPIAEETRQIEEIGAWVLLEAARIAARWPVPLRIAVNVAPRQLLQPDFVESVRDVLMECGLAPARLEIELTEASIIADKERTREVLKGLRNLGVRIAMDDYGTGYASLSALRNYPFDKLKIDRSFVEGLGRDTQAEAIVRSTVLLARGLGLKVLAEGVETRQQANFLRAAGCDEVQGFYFARPAPLSTILRHIHAQAATEEKIA